MNFDKWEFHNVIFPVEKGGASSMNFDKWEFHNVIFPVEKGGASR
jgi:hypothetical protein